MDRYYQWTGLILSLLTILSDPGFGASIIEGPQNQTVLAGSEARFNCTVSERWKVLIWLFDGNPQLTLIWNGTSFDSPRFSQQGHTSGTTFTSELTIADVKLTDSGQIKCSIQNDQDNKYAYLSVQVNGSLSIKDNDFTVKENQTIEIVCEALGWAPAPHIFWMENDISLSNSKYITSQSPGSNGLYNGESTLRLTPMTSVNVTCLAAIVALSRPQIATVAVTVYQPEKSGNDYARIRTIILAVVLPIVALLLVILIILLIVCCKRKKESDYQKEIKKNTAETQTTNRNLGTITHSGNENYGYDPEETMYDTVQMRGIVPVSPRNYGLNQDANPRPPSEVIYNRHYGEAFPSRPTAYPVNPRKIRNVTHV
ncbi:immunoglobulin superfamily member 5 isoform X1 [Anolis carolinensis]|uniref:Ig-like domain-containing protein n=1 Tax=Anolis carolinensis TaxID=28377 RepID=R4GBL7_ANOCA|nr:PREDICTED: immunoglobulin superfamily member 5 isoform X1 [Anolis carolinensis]XP_008105705.1 PREDICTED: immunoglobulin superfamily member 5 isoform X1 [Anolis carolinensis]XP_008105706.1 PREDICTED: immunoglobulin superfamily member 5 isoform X1 [Anolis carolinensis]XP_008105707.1 PREDICTED: immunoglobulin superfamily member 5 isoform X1 [Anolis carolinensis]|eukprot:XP_008105704.1 PREDICTED: immunoglobulin superfamily member 5 isoform X1 [Anolis carolinensis]